MRAVYLGPGDRRSLTEAISSPAKFFPREETFPDMNATCSRLAVAFAVGLLLSCGGGERTSEPAPAETAAPAPPARPANTGHRVEPAPAEAEPPAAEPVPPLLDEERQQFGFPEHLDLPEDARPSELPADVPLPRGATAISEPMQTGEGFTHATYAVEGSASAVQTQFSAGLLAQGWSIEPAGGNATDKALLSATKGNRQLLVAIETIEGKTQLIVVETELPAP
jgi:hypothetical protein